MAARRHISRLQTTCADLRKPQTGRTFAIDMCMLGRKPKARRTKGGAHGTVDGGEGRGIPLGGHDERPPTGYLADEPDIEITDNEDPALFWEEEDPADRRRDPLRKP